MGKQLIFVYNTDNGLANTLVSIGHRLLKPDSYPCKLCAITYGTLGMKRRWKGFIKKIGPKAVFMHRDEFMSKCKFPGYKTTFPAVVIKDNNQMTTLMEAKDFEEIGDLDDLIHVLRSKLINSRTTGHG